MADSLGNLIYIGSVESPIFAFDDDSILTISLNTSVDVTGQEMSADTFEVEVFCDDSDETLRNIPWATAIYYYVKDRQKGKFYITKVTRTGRTKYSIEATSAIGILDYENFYGGIYNGESFADVVDSILWTNGMSKYSYIYGGIHRGICGAESYITQSGVKYVRNMDAIRMYIGTGFYSITHLQAEFKLNRCLLNDYNFLNIDKSGTTVRLYLLGMIAGPNNDNASTEKNQCGIYMDVTKSNTSAAWPDYGELFVKCGSFAYSLGTPTEPTTYEIDIDYHSDVRKIKVNNTEFTMDESVTTPGWYTFVPYAGGLMREGSTNTTPNVCCDIEYGKYIITNGSDDSNMLADVRALRDAKNGLRVYNFADDYRREHDVAIYWAEGIDEDGYKLFSDNDFISDVDADLSYADGINTLTVYGWLPVCTKREALHQLMFSKGVSLIKNASGGLIFTKLVNTIAGEIPNTRLYAEGSEEYLGHTNMIEITEHSFVDMHEDPEASEETIYENQIYQGEDFYYAVFEKSPSYMTDVSDELRWYFYNCNAALVTGRGTISGFPYMHGQKVRTRKIGEYADGKSVSVTDVPLITLQNSEMLADRMEAYYGHAYKIQNAILVEGERCGMRYEFSNPFSEDVSGFMSKMNQNVSSIIKGDCEFVVNYNASNSVNGFNHYVILTGSGTWTVPDSVYQEDSPRIRVVLIGGGDGGASGFAGEDGETLDSEDETGSAAEGGDVGENGSPGKVIDVTIDNPANTLTYSAGAGGVGGAVNSSKTTNNPGGSGGDTTITIGGETHTSANGNVPTDGYYNFFTGDAYAKTVTRPLGTEHLMEWGSVIQDTDNTHPAKYYGKGCSGGYWYLEHVEDESNVVTCKDSGYAASEKTINYRDAWHSEPGLSMILVNDEWNFYGNRGGAGGGSAYGANGENGQNIPDETQCGNGGNGADAVKTPPKPTDYNPKYFGYGGVGGAGGGGGGSSGYRQRGYTTVAGVGGTGGKGGKGGDGGDGCVLIYY